MVAALYLAAMGRAPWSEPFGMLASRYGLWAVQLVGIEKNSGKLLFTAEGGPVSPQAALDYIRFFHPINPRIEPTLATRAGEWMNCQEHFGAAYVAGSRFYQDFLIPHGGRYLSATKLIDDDQMTFLFGVMRGNGSSPLTAAELLDLGKYGAHLAEAMRGMMAMRGAFAELRAARELLSQFGYPMLLIDETRWLWHRNDAAVRWLAAEGPVMESRGYLLCRSPGDEVLLTEPLRVLRAEQSGRSLAGRRALRLKGNDGRNVLAFVSAVEPRDSMATFGEGFRALVVLHDPALRQPALDPFIVAECFDLTPAESRVAVLIAGGATPKAISQRLDVGLATVRTQLQRAMEKMGVTRQPDLVRVLLKLPSRD
ncbi:MAG TPA: LuxR C-terminal-related transcriptional regulator [Ramlibacter sp.]